MNHALDAGPMIAFLDGEPGVLEMLDVLTEPGSTCYAHIYNLAEVCHRCFRRAGAALAERSLETLLDAGVIVRDDSDTAFWKEAAALYHAAP